MYTDIYKRITAQQSRVHSRRRLRIGCDGGGENSSRGGDSSEKEWATTGGGGGVYLAAVIPFPTPERRKPMAWAAAGSIQGGAVQVESIPRPDLTGVRVYMEGGHTAARLRCAREFIIAAVAATTTTQPMRRHYDVDDPRNHYGCCEPNLVEDLGIYSGVICIIIFSAEK